MKPSPCLDHAGAPPQHVHIPGHGAAEPGLFTVRWIRIHGRDGRVRLILQQLLPLDAAFTKFDWRQVPIATETKQAKP